MKWRRGLASAKGNGDLSVRHISLQGKLNFPASSLASIAQNASAGRSASRDRAFIAFGRPQSYQWHSDELAQLGTGPAETA
jgi:hypothetical protein